MGQGIWGLVWLVVALAGGMRWSVVAGLCAVGWLAVPAIRLLLVDRSTPADRSTRGESALLLPKRSWYFYVAVAIGVVCVLRGVIALLPPDKTDALRVYLVMPRAVAASGALEFQAFAHPFYGLIPLQVELHWAALFAISNETAVGVWDYLCSLSVILGTTLFARHLTSSRRAAVIAALIILSTPAFYHFMGGGKVDNAAAQYGIAAFLWLALLPALGRGAAILAGLSGGWALGSRYTDVILVPALVLFAALVGPLGFATSRGGTAAPPPRLGWPRLALAAGLGAACAGMPMLIKNWLLVGCPLAPQFGCDASFWAAIYRGLHSTMGNLTVRDLLFYPIVGTFGDRVNMLGNISPLFFGLAPLALLYGRAAAVRPALVAGLAGLFALITWLLLEPRILHPRWLLVPLVLWAPVLGACLVHLDHDHRRDRWIRWSVRATVIGVFVVLLFDARGSLHGLRYLASIDARSARYEREPGYDIALWLNSRVRSGERVALGSYSGYPYFLDPQILLQSESRAEFQWLWEYGGRSHSYSAPLMPHGPRFLGIKAMVLAPPLSSDLWRFYVDHGFAYVVLARDQLDTALKSWGSPGGARLDVAFEGRDDSVLRIATPSTGLRGVGRDNRNGVGLNASGEWRARVEQ